MAKRVSVAKAKAQFSALMAEAAYGGKHILIERRGKPMAALVSVSDLEHLERTQGFSDQPLGALALTGAWLFRWSMFIDGQRIPKTGAGFYDYPIPAGAEGWLGMLGTLGLWVVLLILLTSILPWHPEKSKEDESKKDESNKPETNPIDLQENGS